jgi:hypothetical protein
MTHLLFAQDVSQFGVERSVVERYFSTLNQGRFQETADLFAVDGVLFPPFDEPVSGREAIVSYLHKEADGMEITPQKFNCKPTTNGITQVQVRGRVKVLVFEVQVGWDFLLNSQTEIEQVRVNLLASLEELLHLRSGRGNRD